MKMSFFFVLFVVITVFIDTKEADCENAKRHAIRSIAHFGLSEISECKNVVRLVSVE